jgi:23S rRNA (pseudouridine1915-N3)-methyltransferase
MLPVKIRLITLGKLSKEYEPLVNMYEKRISSLSHAKFIKGGKLPPEAILLDPQGEELSSEEFYALIHKHSSAGREIVLAVGPPEGFGEVQGHRKISLSKLTFQHDLAYLILLEQIYRALLRMKGTRYNR